ncbi:MAG: sigma-70 family RNA polymerase sigma factor [Candidatus Rokuibacteriota bacterium]
MLEWAKPGDRTREFEETALVHLDTLYRSALRLTHNRAEAEDLVQETCLRAFRGFHRFNPGTNCRAWLLTILRNEFLKRLKHGGREVLDGDLGDHHKDATSITDEGRAGGHPEEEFLQTMLHGDVDRALRALPLVNREVVVLADFEGCSYREIAQIVDCPIGTVMSRLSRGRAQLRQLLGRLGREHGYVKESE